MKHKWNLQKKKKMEMNLFTRETFTGIENEVMVTKKEKEGWDKLGVLD